VVYDDAQLNGKIVLGGDATCPQERSLKGAALARMALSTPRAAVPSSWVVEGGGGATQGGNGGGQHYPARKGGAVFPNPEPTAVERWL